MQQKIAIYLVLSSVMNITYNAYAQIDSTKIVTLKEVTVSAYQDEVIKQSSLHIEIINTKDINKQGSFNIADALSKIPGVSQLSTGVAISKPVLRGLYGNRVLVLFSGLRFDNQQWQEEHGLGISDIGISKVELIKGPLSLLYGTDAVGGVIHIIEENKASEGTSETDAGLKFNTNTLGETVQFGTKANNGKRWYRFRFAAENHADYSDGNNARVTNSRFNGYYLKGSFGFKRIRWVSDNNYNFSLNNFGFVFGDINQFFTPDARWSRSMIGPHHIVMLNMLSTQNTLQFDKSSLKIDGGLQSNLRAEDEGGGALSLIMHLITTQYSAKWNKALNSNTNFVLANNCSFENNTNFGGRKIIPDANMFENALSGFVKKHYKKLIIEYGFGGGLRYIQTKLTPTVNTFEKDIKPFAQTRIFSNGLVGLSYNPNKNWNVKLNAATGVRAPNLAELSSNGLHEGIYTYEIGNPNLKNERNLNVDFTNDFANERLELNTSIFYNHFINYIYLQPSPFENWYGFPVFRIKQNSATIYGGEASVALKNTLINNSKVSFTYAALIGKLSTGEYLPYMPAQKVKPQFDYDFILNKKHETKGYFFVNSEFIMQQNLLSASEKNTPAYTLLNAGLGLTFQQNNKKINLVVAGNNILNKAYYDHLSRFKNFGLLNIGRNIMVSINISFLKNIKNK
jgi:iron complex outermembrane receptor protein